MKNEQRNVKLPTALLRSAALIAVLLGGLSAGICASTSAAQKLHAIVQNDIAIEPAFDSAAAAMFKPRVALLLPTHKSALAEAAAAVQAGFLAALKADAQSSVSIYQYESGDDNQENLNQYRNAQAATQLVVGPLSRNLTSVLASVATVPTIALSPKLADAANSTSPLVLAIGLSIEEEARQLAQWAHASEAHGVAWIISTKMQWQLRAAHAFEQALRVQGRRAQLFEMRVADGVLDPEHLNQLRDQAHDAAPALLMLALDYQQAIQLREALGSETPAYGTSQLNPFTAAQWEKAEPQAQLEGLRLLELPCRLHQDPGISKEVINADLDRLQALGRDAYEIMLPILAGQQHFLIEGNTGLLEIQFGKGEPARLSRKLKPAMYANGRVIVMPVHEINKDFR